MYPKSIKNLIDSFKYFPGIGEKTAERLAFSVLNMDHDQIEMIGTSISTIKKDLKAGNKYEVIDEKRDLIEFNNGDLVTKALDVFGKDIVEIE